MLTVLGGEPWCFAPEVIAGLTDYQILHLFVLPKALVEENADRARRGLAPEGESTLPTDADGVPHRGYMVGLMMSLGLTAEQANADYEMMLKEHTDQKRGG